MIGDEKMTRTTYNRNNRRKRHTRIASKPRFITFLLLCIMAACSFAGFFTNATADKESETYTLCISAGDTLWDIAASANTAKKDVRNVIDDIMKLNNLKSPALNVGDTIEIPVY